MAAVVAPPTPPPTEPEPAVPAALLDHDYCTFGEPPPPEKTGPGAQKTSKSTCKTRRHSHKKHRSKKSRYNTNYWRINCCQI